MRKSSETNKQNGKQSLTPPKIPKVKKELEYQHFNYVMDYKSYIKFLEDSEKEFRKQY